MTGAMAYSLPESRGYMGDPRRGASMGRGTCHAADKSAPIRFYLRRVRLDTGGYDGGGASSAGGGVLAVEASSVDLVATLANARAAA